MLLMGSSPNRRDSPLTGPYGRRPERPEGWIGGRHRCASGAHGPHPARRRTVRKASQWTDM
jgi:hypothetical protein